MGFKCECALCLAEEADEPVVRKMREEFEDKATDFIGQEKAVGAGKVLINKAKRLRKSIDETYDEKRCKGLPQQA